MWSKAREIIAYDLYPCALFEYTTLLFIGTYVYTVHIYCIIIWHCPYPFRIVSDQNNVPSVGVFIRKSMKTACLRPVIRLISTTLTVSMEMRRISVSAEKRTYLLGTLRKTGGREGGRGSQRWI